MATDQLPDSFDVVVCGTGLPESMVAACLSRIGKKVLHLDRNEYYGGQWATFTFESLNKWITKYEKQEEGQSTISNHWTVPSSDVCIRNVVIRSYIPDKSSNIEDPVLNGHINEISGNNKAEESNNEMNFNNDTIKKVVKRDEEEDKNSEFTMNDVHQNSDMAVKDASENDDVAMKDVYQNSDMAANDVDQNIDVTAKDANQNSDVAAKDVDQNSDVAAKDANQNDVAAKGNTHVTENLTSACFNPTVNNKSRVPLTMISQARIRQNFDDISLEDFLALSRKFNLDITTKFLFSAGPLVNAIIKANISHYAEFKVVNRILTWKDDQIMEVPCNRSDVFGSTFLTMIEKRVLMKFLTLCVESPSEECEEINAFNGRPFKEFLESRRLSENLQKFIIYSIALVKPDTPTELAMIETRKFLQSLGRYGKSPFIWPLYGIGELPQAFCRMSAVFGGTYCLNSKIETIECVEKGKFKTCIDGQKIESDHIILDNSYVPYRFNAHTSDTMISKGILITNQSLLPTAEEHLSFLTIPPLLGHEESVRVIEIGPASSACPSGLFVLYLMCASSYATAEQDLLQYTTLLTAHNEEGSNKPKLLWSLYYNQLEDVIFEDVPDKMFIPSMPDVSLGFELAVEEAKKIFHSICPDEEFMLAVPNSEDIIWGIDSEEKNITDNTDNTNLNNEGSLDLDKTDVDSVGLQDIVNDDPNESEKTVKNDSTDKDDKVTCHRHSNFDNHLPYENGFHNDKPDKEDILCLEKVVDNSNDKNCPVVEKMIDASFGNCVDDHVQVTDESINNIHHKHISHTIKNDDFFLNGVNSNVTVVVGNEKSQA